MQLILLFDFFQLLLSRSIFTSEAKQMDKVVFVDWRQRRSEKHDFIVWMCSDKQYVMLFASFLAVFVNIHNYQRHEVKDYEDILKTWVSEI